MRSYARGLADLDRIPPPICRLIARTKSRYPRILSIRDIAKAARLKWQTVAWIARQKSFARVTVEDAYKFRRGCGITPENEQRHLEYIKRNNERPTGWSHVIRTAKTNWPRGWKSRFLPRIAKRLPRRGLAAQKIKEAIH